MADRLRRAALRLAVRTKAHAGRAVEYWRGGRHAELTVTLGDSLLRVGDDRGGSRTVHVDRDYIVTAADLVLDGAAVTPRRGDEIRDAVDLEGVVRVYEVRSPGGDEPPYQLLPGGVQYRVHTKLKGSE